MPPSLAELLRDWHDFYTLAGAASATLVGLIFVGASIGSSIFNEEHRVPIRAFLTPTVVHFAVVLFTCLLVTIPSESWRTLGGLLGAEGIAGLVYCARLLMEIIVRHRFGVDLIDRLFYATIPFLGYLLISASAGLLVIHSSASVNLIAAGLLTLLVAAIRNAWDMTLWIVIRVPTSRGPSP
jgi:hypothetical protein